jgi:hypothetical protein
MNDMPIPKIDRQLGRIDNKHDLVAWCRLNDPMVHRAFQEQDAHHLESGCAEWLAIMGLIAQNKALQDALVAAKQKQVIEIVQPTKLFPQV